MFIIVDMEQIKQETKQENKPKVQLDSEPNLSKKPIWYLFLFANVLILIACAVTFALMYKTERIDNPKLYILPTAICNPLAILLAILFIWLEAKDIAPMAMHFQKKWLKHYIIAGSFFIAAILFNVIYYLTASRYEQCIPPAPDNKLKWVWIIYLAVTGVFTLISIGFQRYARFRIDLDVYRRKRGVDANAKKEEGKDKPDSTNEKSKPAVKTKKAGKKPTTKKSTKKPKVTNATGGLLDQMDN